MCGIVGAVAQRDVADILVEGLKRLELLIEQDTIEKLDKLCELNGLKRAEWLTLQINKSVEKIKNNKLKA